MLTATLYTRNVQFGGYLTITKGKQKLTRILLRLTISSLTVALCMRSIAARNAADNETGKYLFSLRFF